MKLTMHYFSKIIPALIVILCLLIGGCKDKFGLKETVYTTPKGSSNKVSFYQDFYNTDTSIHTNFMVYVDDTVWGGLTVNTLYKKIGDLSSKNVASKTFKVTLVSPPPGYYNYMPGFDRKAPPDPSMILAEKQLFLSAQGNTSVYITFDGAFDKFRIEGYFNDGYEVPTVGKFKLRILNLAKQISKNVDGELISATPQPFKVTYLDKTPIDGLPPLIGYGQLTNYIELPTDFYQFRLLDENNNILNFPGFGGSPSNLFNAGEVYTLVVRNAYYFIEDDKIAQSYSSEFKKESSGIIGTSDSTITTVQILNADYTHPGGLSAALNSASSYNLGFGQATPSINGALGNNMLKILDVSGQELLTDGFPLAREQSPMIYILPTANGSQKIEYLQTPAAWWNKFNGFDRLGNHTLIYDTFIQFINLSPDAGTVDFTNSTTIEGYNFEKAFDGGFSNGLSYKQFFNAIRRNTGTFPDIMSYVASGNENGVSTTPVKLSVRKTITTDSGTERGKLITSLDYPFVANPQQYMSGGVYNGPKGEPGFYVVALVGLVNSTDPVTKARLVVIKRSK